MSNNLPIRKGSTKRHPFLSSVEELIEEARNGRIFILVDDENRENEGDLVIPAQMATPAAINFMATHGRGLICLAMTKERITSLGLEPMARENNAPLQTAFTVSIEAKTGVTTGISAGDRARTVAVAIDSARGADDIVTPGHVFPLSAKSGGVLVRAGHTEAAVDIARLAGLNASGVICEVMKEDGTMARLDDLVTFAQRHNIKIGTIRDLITWRREHDNNVERIEQKSFNSLYGGDWEAIRFNNKASGSETVALVKGKIDPDKPTLVRMHAVDPFTDMLGQTGPRQQLLSQSMKIIAEEGTGVVVLIHRAEENSLDKTLVWAAARSHEKIHRDYGIGAQILAELGVRDMILLTNSHHMPVALSGYGLNIVGEQPIAEGI
ncbi:MAG: 3,4-dihydroxy-2-butanone-4-phosphate synthase [Zymomonas mobilis subsp. pomaceae]|uniref:3,4-dihydroxy-2-butanone 4-phosphate synthase n=1 Tax=Zymomonas mobilis subsp. pomaceae (strain ATCC 29192 / DSM 22645 / JCM 10191 / CCUG 17912 / NBRC 13757 / NCIMB 11200 / NRRL B-4491 / Barker I) TaxID=579138 RepID=F8ES71_ZYMMT|nr:3,4-dihydroxy-2-butanone-4-phosphate synthase [Zymomonas mobilis]AEI37646.1 3,4-dihydroxy-2-butanone 4-phosphate synthase [Zymomonas mobilis subsp. pomaceae ATCC 29192]MDX5949013.1 3,4-dihydroxy-2-butanone-4-phosphate synthase [Zymomonas mobilis subsp. pomaceae]GEB88818.1 3,4-dihydroxy-2-butanone 4-phosphate synthase [Zymomonas mobilis subsp. pomaceae]